MTGFGYLGFWLGKRILEDVLLYGSDVLCGPAILLVLGPYVITARGGFSVNNGTRDVHNLCWGQEQYLMAGV